MRARSVKIDIADDLFQQAATIPHLLNPVHNKKLRIVDVGNVLDHINLLLADNNFPDKKKVLLEKFKLAVIAAVNTYLENLTLLKKAAKPEPEKQPSGFWYWGKVALLSLFSLIGLTETSVMTFLGSRVLLTSLIPGIPFPVLLIVGIIITLINAVQFIGFQVGTLRTLFGVKTRGSAKQIIEAHEQQIDAVADLNNSLTDVNILGNLTKKDYIQLKNIAVRCNEDIELKKTVYKEYKEHTAKKVFRYIFTAFGAIMSIVGSYFGATMFLTTMAPAMLNTALGWIIRGGLVSSSVVFYFAMQGRGLWDMFNPLVKAFDVVKDKVKSFRVISDAEFSSTLLNDKVFKKSDAPEVSEKIKALDLAVAPRKKIAADGKLFSRSQSAPQLHRIIPRIRVMR